MKKMLMSGILSMFIIGCASSNKSVSSVSIAKPKDFSSSIRAFDAKNDMEYLKSASSYAVTDSEKAILERKLVEYLGADKVFDVQISNSLGGLNTFSASGLIFAEKGSSKHVKISVKVTPRANLPFTLKYNTYKIKLGIKKNLESEVKHYVGGRLREDKIQKFSKILPMKDFTLSPSNNWSFSGSINTDVAIYFEEGGINEYATHKLQKLTFDKSIDVIPKDATLVDHNNNLEWQNYYPYIKGIKKTTKLEKYGQIEYVKNIEKYCSQLRLNGDGWEVPYLTDMIHLSQNKSLVNRMSSTSLLYFNHTLKSSFTPIRLSDGNTYRYSVGESYAVRCVRAKNQTLFDKETGLEWANNKIVYRGNQGWAEKVCSNLSLKGKGWRVPTPNELSRIMKNKSLQFNDTLRANKAFWTSYLNPNPSADWNEYTKIVKSNGEIVNWFYDRRYNGIRCVRKGR